MGRVFWMTSVASAAVVIFVLSEGADQVESVEAAQLAYADTTVHSATPDIGTPEDLPDLSHSGFALATAAFGMSALQPETYDGDLVASIIAASPLEEVEKVQLTSNLQQAEEGDADLHRVLSDVRSALAVD
ncbi:MAG: hypothetical protein ABJF50_11410 [Paracoccaceae bacterium]